MKKNSIGQMILLCTVTASVAISGLQYAPQAEILSADGRDALEYAVGSDVTVHCHLRNESVDVSKVTMYLSANSVELETAVVNASVVSATMRSGTSLLDELVCREGQGKVLTSRTLCIGSVPDETWTSSCHWNLLTENLSCCTNDGPINSCNVYSAMERSVKGQSWELFKELSVTTCGEFSVPNSKSTRVYSIRIFFSSQIGNSSTIISIQPLENAVPLPVEKLIVTEGTNGATLVLWENHWKIRDDVCDKMGLSYSIIAQPLKSAMNGLKPYSQVIAANCSQIPDDYPMHYSIPGLDQYTTYNITIIPFSKKNITGEAKSFISVGNTSRVTTVGMTFTYVIAAVIGCSVAILLSAFGVWYCKRRLKKKCLKFANSLELDMTDSEDGSSDHYFHEQQAGVTLAKDSCSPVPSMDSAFVDLPTYCPFDAAAVRQVLDNDDDERTSLMVKRFGVDENVHCQTQERVGEEEVVVVKVEEVLVKYIQREVTQTESLSSAADASLCRDESVCDSMKNKSEEEDNQKDNSEEEDSRKDNCEGEDSRKDTSENANSWKDNSEEKDSRKDSSEEEDSRKSFNNTEPRAAMDMRHPHGYVTAQLYERRHHGYVTTQLLCQAKGLGNGIALHPGTANGYVRRVD